MKDIQWIGAYSIMEIQIENKIVSKKFHHLVARKPSNGIIDYDKSVFHCVTYSNGFKYYILTSTEN